MANHVTHRIDVRQRRSVHTVDFEAVHGYLFRTNILQRQRISVTGTAISMESGQSAFSFAGFQVHIDAIIAAFDFLILFIVAEHHAAVPEGREVGHLLIEKGQPGDRGC